MLVIYKRHLRGWVLSELFVLYFLTERLRSTGYEDFPSKAFTHLRHSYHILCVAGCPHGVSLFTPLHRNREPYPLDYSHMICARR